MKRIDHHTRTLAAAVLLCFAAFAAPAFAAPDDRAARTEMRIESMHAKLKITKAQEEPWKAVAQVMRDNETALEPLMVERKKSAATMTALDDLKSYADITDAHLQGIRRFNPVFGALYASMSEPQKKEADTLFRRGPGKAMHAK
jgi:protein CpxP